MIRRLAPTVAASLTALVLLAVPALAGSSISPSEAPANQEGQAFTVTITEPEGYETQTVTVTAPQGFSNVACAALNTWSCQADGTTATFERIVGGSDLNFTATTPGVNGTYSFAVVQRDSAGENPQRSAPSVTITGGQDPAPADDGGETDDGAAEDSTDDGGSTSEDTSGGSDSTDSGSTTEDTTAEDSGTTDDSGTSTDDDSSGTTSDSDDDSTSDGGGSTSPRRTEGRSNGTSLQITPGESTTNDDASISAPDVADDPAIAPPSDGEEDDAETGTATMTAIEGQAGDEPDDAGGLPWQQLLGGALLVAGGAALAVRRWDLLDRVRGWDPLERIRRSS